MEDSGYADRLWRPPVTVKLSTFWGNIFVINPYIHVTVTVLLVWVRDGVGLR